MQNLPAGADFKLDAAELEAFRSVFQAARVDEAETLAEIRRLRQATGYLADPHTAIGTAAAFKVGHEPAVPMISLATAHPAKFPDAVTRAVGAPPPPPEQVLHQSRLEERVTVLPNDFATVARFIEARVGAGRSL
jgi:threonine synthase